MYVGECFADGVWKPCLRVGIVENGARLRVFSFKYDEKTPDSKGSGGSRNIKYATQFVRLFPTS